VFNEIITSFQKLEDIRFYDLSVYHYNLNDKQNCIITAYVLIDDAKTPSMILNFILKR